MDSFYNLLKKIQTKKAKIGIIGQGYVGLPLAICFAKKGFQVTGLEIDSKKVKAINQGKSYLEGMGIEKDLQNVVKKGFLKATDKIITGCKEQGAIIICVQTPVTAQHRPDFGFLKQAALDIAASKPLGKLIINESTVAPSTTESVVGAIIEKKSGLKAGRDFFLGCSPERINPGDFEHQVENTPKIVSGLEKKDLQLVKALYSSVIRAPLIPVSSLAAAEASKILENCFRAVNIALVNELAKFCQKTDLDILEIIEAAKSKWSFLAHYPGIGVGGHCIPVDPYYLLEEAAKREVSLSVLEKAMAENESMPGYVLSLLAKNYSPKSSILVYGLTYKKGVKDMRESPALAFCKLLKQKNYQFEVYDPLFSVKEIQNYGLKPCRKLKRFDFLVVATDHQALAKDALKIIGKKTIIIDGRNFFKKNLGQKTIGVGRGEVNA